MKTILAAIESSRTLLRRFVGHADLRDLLFAAGGLMLFIGGERLYPGAGYAAIGAVLLAVAVWMR